MRQIVYFSTAAEPQTRETIQEILIASRINNRRDSITGLLVAGGNRYMQIIEGQREAVDRLYGAIRADHRHLSVTTLVERPISQRCFDGWSMAFRSEPRLGEFDRFPDIVRYLVEQVDDSIMKTKIRSFARVFIGEERGVSAPWTEGRRTA